MDNNSKTNTLLNNKWTFWYHLNNDTNWNLDSYTRLASISNKQKLDLILNDYINEESLIKSTLFLMRNDINPTWEDKNNINGGSFSLKVPNKLIYETWKTIIYKTINETLFSDSKLVENTTGISLSPKKYYCIIKIWVSSCENTNIKLLDLTDTKVLHDVCLFKKHVSC